MLADTSEARPPRRKCVSPADVYEGITASWTRCPTEVAIVVLGCAVGSHSQRKKRLFITATPGDHATQRGAPTWLAAVLRRQSSRRSPPRPISSESRFRHKGLVELVKSSTAHKLRGLAAVAEGNFDHGDYEDTRSDYARVSPFVGELKFWSEDGSKLGREVGD
ncbi:hypothetical protein D9611_005999 [Ephemerocybe angulata]|uniref:Uncharacterized protein n=1 Tax=Ephemerocybe angulata TaxID=980116 RepID=A0A8H5CG15_9AGAR|nr:hypothetical protein D9611_005999 [Tulosesus angulatus]